QAITVAVVGDSAVESTEQFSVTLSGAVNASLDKAAGVGRILDNDTRTLSINDVTVVEGDSGPTNAVFTVTLSAAALAPVTVSFTTSDSSAVAPADYAAQTGHLTFDPGATTQTITVAVLGDSAVESIELFGVTLSGAVNATLDDGSGVGRILDNDRPTVSFNVVIVAEGVGGGTTGALEV